MVTINQCFWDENLAYTYIVLPFALWITYFFQVVKGTLFIFYREVGAFLFLILWYIYFHLMVMYIQFCAKETVRRLMNTSSYIIILLTSRGGMIINV